MVGRLPQPVGRQREVLCLPAHGHTVVLGTAGSGKTTLAVHRAFYLANPGTDHCGRTLLVTFSRCLIAYLQSLAGRIPHGVDVQNYHRFARGYLNYRGRMRTNCICDQDLVKGLCQQAVTHMRASGVTSSVLDRPIELLVEEFRWLAQHGIRSAEEYRDAERIGRAGARILRAERRTVFDVYERYKTLRKAYGKDYDWQDLSHAVVDEFSADTTNRMYRHVVIDEGQDLSPMELASLSAAIPSNGSLTFFGDMVQQIYGNRMSWRSAGLNVSNVWMFEENYRNTQQIAQLALALAAMPTFPAEADLVAPKAPTADGPLPALVSFSNESDEDRFVAQQAIRLAKTSTVAVLFRDRDQEKGFVRSVSQQGTRLHKDLDRWPSGPGVFYGTYHAAKGLEFDGVILPHLSTSHFPHPPDVGIFGAEETAARDSRLLYVGITRAKSNLILTHTGPVTHLLPDSQDLYQRTEK